MCLVFRFFVFFTFFCSWKSQADLLSRVKRDSAVCTISEDELKEMRSSINELYDKEAVTVEVTGCNKLLAQTDSCTSGLKNFLTRKIEGSDEAFNQVKEELTQRENDLVEKLRDVPRPLMEKYQNQIEKIGNTITTIQEAIDKLTINKENYLNDIAFYQDALNNGTKFSTRFDDDSYFTTAKMCTFRRNVVNKLIGTFNEISVLTLGNPQNTQSDCFEELRNQLSNLESIIAHRTGENKIESLRSTFAERTKCLQKLMDDHRLQTEQQSRKNLTDVSDELQRIVLQYRNLKAETEKLRQEMVINGVKTIKMMIRSGTKIRKARNLFIKLRKEFNDSYRQILNRTYACDIESLQNTIVFTQIYSKRTGYEIIANDMKKCGHLESPYLLVIMQVVEDPSLNDYVEKIYEGFVGNLRHGNIEKISKFMRISSDKLIDFPKLFRLALKDLKLWEILRFIDGLHAYDQYIIVDLYDQMMQQGFQNSEEHINIAQWIRDRLNWIKRQSSYSAITGDLEPYLEQLKDKLPDGIRTFVFEPSVILAMKDHEYLLRSDSHDSVKFMVQPDESGKFYRFEDLRFKKAFYAENFQDAEKNTKMRVRMGTGTSDAFYWQVIPTDNGEFFYLKNKQNGHYLSSREDNVCMRKGFWGSCKSREWMNLAYSDNTSLSTKWMFTTALIRNGILPDRNSG